MSNTTKTIDKICPDAGLWIFVVSKASGRSLPTTIQAVYIRIIRRIYTEIRYLYGNIYTIFPYIYVLYGVYIRRLKFTYGVYEYGYGENLFIHTYIYGTYLYGVYILIRFGPTLLIYAPYMTAFMGVTLLLDGKYAQICV